MISNFSEGGTPFVKTNIKMKLPYFSDTIFVQGPQAVNKMYFE